MTKLSVISSILLASTCQAAVVSRAPPVVCPTKDSSPLVTDVQKLHDQVARDYIVLTSWVDATNCHTLGQPQYNTVVMVHVYDTILPGAVEPMLQNCKKS